MTVEWIAEVGSLVTRGAIAIFAIYCVASMSRLRKWLDVAPLWSHMVSACFVDRDLLHVPNYVLAVFANRPWFLEGYRSGTLRSWPIPISK
jgi:hypothetical protein